MLAGSLCVPLFAVMLTQPWTILTRRCPSGVMTSSSTSKTSPAERFPTFGELAPTPGCGGDDTPAS